MICNSCDARCCKNKLITVTIFDVLRIMEHGRKFEEFVSLEYPKIINMDERFLLRCKEKKVEMDYILALKSYPCVFLENNRCSIYEYAPTVCKVYPFNLEGKVLENADCGFRKVFFKIRGISKEIVEKMKREEEEYASIVKEWNKIRGNKKECIEFLIKRGKEINNRIV